MNEQPLENVGDEAVVKEWMRRNYSVRDGAFDRAGVVKAAQDHFEVYVVYPPEPGSDEYGATIAEPAELWQWAAEIEREVFPPTLLGARKAELGSMAHWMRYRRGLVGTIQAFDDALDELELRIQKLDLWQQVLAKERTT